MATSTAAPKLMHFPMARRLAMQGWRIRRQTWNAVPTLLTNLTDYGNTASLTLSPGVRKLAWLEYRAGLWFITTWQEVPSGGLGEWVKTTIPRVVNASDLTVADLLAEDWTVYDVGCDLSKNDDCACAALDALSAVPAYPVQAEGEDIEGELDIYHGNARKGVTGCDIDLSGGCSCADAGSASSSSGGSGGSTTSTKELDPTLGGGGSGLPNTSTGIAIKSGGSNGTGGGGNGPRPRPQPLPPSDSSVTVDVECSQTECYNLADYGLTEAGAVRLDPPPQFFGNFTLNAPDDGVLWFFSITFRGNVVDTGLISGGSTHGFNLGAQADAQPDQHFPVTVHCSKPGQPPDSADGSATGIVPPWCTPDARDRSPRRREPPTDERRPARRPDDRRNRRRPEERRRPDERRRPERRPPPRRTDPPPVDRRTRRPEPPRRPERRPPPSYGITVTVEGNRTDCYHPDELSGMYVPSLTFSGSFTVDAPEGSWSYTVTFAGETIATGSIDAGASQDFSQEVADAVPGDHRTVTVHATRLDDAGTADGSALGNVPDLCNDCPGENESLNESTNTCECDSGYYRDDSGACVAEPTCGTHEELNTSTHECECEGGYYRNDSGTCVADPTCSSHQHVNPDTHECECDPGYSMVEGSCLINCDGPHEMRSGDACVCEGGYYRDGSGNCVAEPTCGANETLNTGTHECECSSGYYRDGTGNCVAEPTCGANMHIVDHVCVCNDGYEMSGGDCVLPPCSPGYHRDEFDNCVPD